MQLIILIISLVHLSATQNSKDIDIILKFNNSTNEKFTFGFVTVEGENHLKVIRINSLDDLRISVPEQGRYIFHFNSDFYQGEFMEPDVVFDQSAILVKIKPLRLESNNMLTNKTTGLFFIFKKKVKFSDLSFIIHGISHQYDERLKNFTDKYEVDFEYKNCIIDPQTYQFSKINNSLIAELLKKEYGEVWLKELPTLPLGVLGNKSQ